MLLLLIEIHSLTLNRASNVCQQCGPFLFIRKLKTVWPQHSYINTQKRATRVSKSRAVDEECRSSAGGHPSTLHAPINIQKELFVTRNRMLGRRIRRGRLRKKVQWPKKKGSAAALINK